MTDAGRPIEKMNSAWATRRRYLSTSGDEQQALMREVHALLTAVVTSCRASGALPELAQAIHLLANVERDMRRDEIARTLWEEAVSICRSVGDEIQLAHKVRHLGDVHRDLGAAYEAERCYEEALTLYRRNEEASPLDFANALARMASLKERSGAEGEAARLWKEARDLYDAAGLSQGVEDCARRLARLQP